VYNPRVRAAISIAMLALSCTGSASEEKLWSEPTAPERLRNDHAEVSVAGIWRATLLSPGGDLPFSLSIFDKGGKLSGEIHNGEERLAFSSIEQTEQTLVFRIDHYDSEITATLGDEGRTLQGQWQKTVPKGKSKLPFSATKGDNRRFLPEFDSSLEPVAGAPDIITGNWALEFTEEDGSTFPGRAELVQQGSEVSGTILTNTGDYRYLAGSYSSGWLLLSVFDGGHAFLFEARVSPEETMQGDFWSRDTYHATWTGKPIPKGKKGDLENPWKAVELTARDGRFRFSFEDLAGNVVSDRDERFKDKVVLVDIFGTWCPNCNDQAALLAKWHETYADQGLEIVGLAYEMTGDVDRDREYVEKYRDKYGIKYPLLLAGLSNKAKAGETVPDLSRIKSFPTTIFVGRDGKVRKIYSGFAGPATGRHHRKMVASHEKTLEELLVEGQDAPAD
jgi:thiol-disulfide isomerase/thioredoxin